MRHLTRREWLSRSAAAAAVWSVGGLDHLLAQGEGTLADTAHGRDPWAARRWPARLQRCPVRRTDRGRRSLHASHSGAVMDRRA